LTINKAEADLKNMRIMQRKNNVEYITQKGDSDVGLIYQKDTICQNMINLFKKREIR
jgi:hypothetical protein